MTGLKKCRNCGGHGIIRGWKFIMAKNRNGEIQSPINFWFVECSKCGRRTFDETTAKKAIYAWNNGYICE